jgi:hypothetical protein
MSNNNLHIIQRLKQQPKQGGIWDDLANAYNNMGDATTGLTNSNNILIGGLGKVNAEIRDLADNYSAAVSKTNFLEEANKGLQQSFGLNIENATVLGAELDNMSKSLGVGGNKLRKYRQDLKALVGGFAGVKGAAETTQKFLYTTQTVIQNNLKLSAEQANKFTQYAALTGKKSDEMLIKYDAIAKSLSTSYGIQVSARDLVEDTAALTEDLQVQYGKIPQKLALAVVKAKALGLTMADLNKTGQNLLNIESSIGQEIEYQLLSGRRLVDEVSGQSLTNAYREATLQGDAVKQAELMNTIIKQEGKTLKNNLFARQQMAQLLGTDEATVARTLAKQELLAQIGGETLMGMNVDNLNQAVQSLPDFQQMSDDQKAEYLKQLNETMDVRTTDQRMADALDEMVSTGIILRSGGPSALGVAAGDRSKQALAGQSAVNEQLQRMFNTDANVNIAGTAMAGASTLSGIFGSATDFSDALSDATFTGPWSITTSGNVALSTEAEPTGDLFMGPGGGRVVTGPEGSFALSPNDALLASPTAGQGGDMSAFAAAIVNAINRQTDALTSNSGINAPYWS